MGLCSQTQAKQNGQSKFNTNTNTINNRRTAGTQEMVPYLARCGLPTTRQECVRAVQTSNARTQQSNRNPALDENHERMLANLWDTADGNASKTVPSCYL
eukprot:scpid74251/ scgid6704/ 